MSATHVSGALGAYVLGALEPDEAAAVRAHLARCPACAAEHAELARLPALLDLAEAATTAAAEPLAPSVEERVLDRFARERPHRRPRPRRLRPRIVLAVGGLAAAAAVALVLVLGAGGGERSSGYAVALHGTAAAPAASAKADLRSVAGGTVMHLWVRNLPHDAGAMYEVRCEGPAWSASAGSFRVDTRGRAYVVLTTAARLGEYDTIRIVRGQGPAVLTAKLPA